jgi:hypothetical protein
LLPKGWREEKREEREKERTKERKREPGHACLVSPPKLTSQVKNFPSPGLPEQFVLYVYTGIN